MTPRVIPTAIDGVVIIELQIFSDARGCFVETWHAGGYVAAGIPANFVQDNVSRSARGVLRGLHFQQPYAQGKLVQALDGEIFDVAVDIRRDSPTFGQWVGMTLSARESRQMYIAPGLAHGFCVLSESALVSYKCTEYYHPEAEVSVLWSDPAIGIAWPTGDWHLSPKDANALPLSQIAPERLPRWLPSSRVEHG
jgi:dTDP-4-dehydrorhamnose 3,5-epimerase